MPLKELAPKLSSEQYEKNFQEVSPRMSEGEAVAESNRCLYCYDAPCTLACPTHIDIPKFIKKIASHNLKGSAKTILAANVFGASCARVCPVEALCEGACVHNDLHKKPIQIGRLQRFATDYLFAEGLHTKAFEKGKPNGKKVAMIGAGPASVSCATFLATLGYAITLYDARPKSGGLNSYAIAEYKMTMETALKEIEIAQSLGVKILNGKRVGKDVSLSQLEKEFDAIFLGIGLGKTADLEISGEDLPGVYDALSFIEQVKTRQFSRIDVGRVVAVIGAGNTAVDAVTQAKRLGAERVILIYRRSESEMPAYRYEYELAKSDAIEFMWLTAPKRIMGNDRVEKLECVRTKLGAPDEKGRRAPVVVPGSEFTINVDMVIKSLGQTKQQEFLSAIPKVERDKQGRIKVNPETMQTANPKYFAGGDCVNGGKEVVNAAQDGKKAAAGIHKILTGETVVFQGMFTPTPLQIKK